MGHVHHHFRVSNENLQRRQIIFMILNHYHNILNMTHWEILNTLQPHLTSFFKASLQRKKLFIRFKVMGNNAKNSQSSVILSHLCRSVGKYLKQITTKNLGFVCNQNQKSIYFFNNSNVYSLHASLCYYINKLRMRGFLRVIFVQGTSYFWLGCLFLRTKPYSRLPNEIYKYLGYFATQFLSFCIKFLSYFKAVACK